MKENKRRLAGCRKVGMWYLCQKGTHLCKRPKIKVRREDIRVAAARTQKKSKRGKTELDASAQRKTETLSEMIKKKKEGWAGRRDLARNEEMRILGHSWWTQQRKLGKWPQGDKLQNEEKMRAGATVHIQTMSLLTHGCGKKRSKEGGTMKRTSSVKRVSAMRLLFTTTTQLKELKRKKRLFGFHSWEGQGKSWKGVASPQNSKLQAFISPLLPTPPNSLSVLLPSACWSYCFHLR